MKFFITTNMWLDIDTLCGSGIVCYVAVLALFGTIIVGLFSVAFIPGTPIFLEDMCNILEQFPRLIFNKCYTNIGIVVFLSEVHSALLIN